MMQPLGRVCAHPWNEGGVHTLAVATHANPGLRAWDQRAREMASEWEIAWAGAKSRDPDSSMLPSDPDELAALQREHCHVLRELALAVEAGAIAPRGKALAQWAAKVVSPDRDKDRAVLAQELGVDQAVARLRIKRWASVAARARSDLETAHRSLDEFVASGRAAIEGMVHEIKLMREDAEANHFAHMSVAEVLLALEQTMEEMAASSVGELEKQRNLAPGPALVTDAEAALPELLAGADGGNRTSTLARVEELERRLVAQLEATPPARLRRAVADVTRVTEELAVSVSRLRSRARRSSHGAANPMVAREGGGARSIDTLTTSVSLLRDRVHGLADHMRQGADGSLPADGYGAASGLESALSTTQQRVRDLELLLSREQQRAAEAASQRRSLQRRAEELQHEVDGAFAHGFAEGHGEGMRAAARSEEAVAGEDEADGEGFESSQSGGGTGQASPASPRGEMENGGAEHSKPTLFADDAAAGTEGEPSAPLEAASAAQDSSHHRDGATAAPLSREQDSRTGETAEGAVVLTDGVVLTAQGKAMGALAARMRQRAREAGHVFDALRDGPHRARGLAQRLAAALAADASVAEHTGGPGSDGGGSGGGGELVLASSSTERPPTPQSRADVARTVEEAHRAKREAAMRVTWAETRARAAEQAAAGEVAALREELERTSEEAAARAAETRQASAGRERAEARLKAAQAEASSLGRRLARTQEELRRARAAVSQSARVEAASASVASLSAAVAACVDREEGRVRRCVERLLDAAASATPVPTPLTPTGGESSGAKGAAEALSAAFQGAGRAQQRGRWAPRARPGPGEKGAKQSGGGDEDTQQEQQEQREEGLVGGEEEDATAGGKEAEAALQDAVAALSRRLQAFATDTVRDMSHLDAVRAETVRTSAQQVEAAQREVARAREAQQRRQAATQVLARAAQARSERERREWEATAAARLQLSAAVSLESRAWREHHDAASPLAAGQGGGDASESVRELMKGTAASPPSHAAPSSTGPARRRASEGRSPPRHRHRPSPPRRRPPSPTHSAPPPKEAGGSGGGFRLSPPPPSRASAASPRGHEASVHESSPAQRAWGEAGARSEPPPSPPPHAASAAQLQPASAEGEQPRPVAGPAVGAQSATAAVAPESGGRGRRLSVRERVQLLEKGTVEQLAPAPAPTLAPAPAPSPAADGDRVAPESGSGLRSAVEEVGREETAPGFSDTRPSPASSSAPSSPRGATSIPSSNTSTVGGELPALSSSPTPDDGEGGSLSPRRARSSRRPHAASQDALPAPVAVPLVATLREVQLPYTAEAAAASKAAVLAALGPALASLHREARSCAEALASAGPEGEECEDGASRTAASDALLDMAARLRQRVEAEAEAQQDAAVTLVRQLWCGRAGAGTSSPAHALDGARADEVHASVGAALGWEPSDSETAGVLRRAEPAAGRVFSRFARLLAERVRAATEGACGAIREVCGDMIREGAGLDPAKTSSVVYEGRSREAEAKAAQQTIAPLRRELEAQRLHLASELLQCIRDAAAVAGEGETEEEARLVGEGSTAAEAVTGGNARKRYGRGGDGGTESVTV